MFVNSPLGVSCDTNSGLGMGGRCNSWGSAGPLTTTLPPGGELGQQKG